MNRMRQSSITGVLLAGLIASALISPAASRSPHRPTRLGLDAAGLQTVPGEIIVSYRRGESLSSLLAAHPLVAGARRIGPREALVRLATDASIGSALKSMSRDPRIVYAEPNLPRYLQQAIPNDPHFPHQWGLVNTGQSHVVSGSEQAAGGAPGADISVIEAWSTTRGSNETVIAIIDSGVDVTHPDLAANVWTNPGEIASNGIDDDNNGYVDDIHGWDFAEEDNILYEPNSAYVGHQHGSHVAGTVAAVADNDEGIAGVCPECKIMVLKVMKPMDTNLPPDGLSDTMLGESADVAEAIEYAAAMGADVINGSIAAPLMWSRAERDALKRAIDAGVSPVFAAGNQRGDNDLLVLLDFDGDNGPDSLSPFFPASYNLRGLISVAASNDHDRNGYLTACGNELGPHDWHCSFTNVGRESVDLVAPGVDIVSSVPGGYAPSDGTSMAAPHVAGVAGLIRSAHPDYTPMQVRNALLNSVDKPLDLNTLFSFPGQTATGTFTLSGGRLNAAAALTASTENQKARTDGNISGARSIKRSRQGAVAWPADANDVFKKRLRRGIEYRVSLNGPDDADFDLLVYKPGVREIWQLEGGCFIEGGACKLLLPYEPEADADESRTFTAGKSGIYYFQVAAFLFQGGTYKLKVRKV